MQSKHQSIAELPQTIYAVALLRIHVNGLNARKEPACMIRSLIFPVPGVEPLTQAEAIARAWRVQEESWDSKQGPVADWRRDLATVAWLTQTDKAKE